MDRRQTGLNTKSAESIFVYCNNTVLNSFLDFPKRSFASLSTSTFQTIFTAPDKFKFIFFTSANDMLSLLESEKARSRILGMKISLPSYPARSEEHTSEL